MSTNAMSNEPAAGGGAVVPSNAALDRRLTVLETRFDTILPTLATKQDLAELRADLKGDFSYLFKAINDHFRWIVALFATLFIGMLGANCAMWNSMERILEANLRQWLAHQSSPTSPPTIAPRTKSPSGG